jgi:hypothetical protein
MGSESGRRQQQQAQHDQLAGMDGAQARRRAHHPTRWGRRAIRSARPRASPLHQAATATVIKINKWHSKVRIQLAGH